jgi:hypothetical protein
MLILATLEKDGWQLESAETRHAASPESFWIPARLRRETLRPGDGAKLLFRLQADTSASAAGGVERMWVIVRRRAGRLYLGVLDSTPAAPEAISARLARGTEVVFAPEHVADISTPPREYVVEHHGQSFFDE